MLLGIEKTAFYSRGIVSTTWEPINGAVTSTTQYKFGTASMAIPLTLTPTTVKTGIKSVGGDQTMFNFGTGDFTVEFYVYWNLTTPFGRQDIMGLFQTDGFGIISYNRFGSPATSYIQIINGNGPDTFEKGTFTFATDTWLYFCVQRSGTTINMWMNGTPLSLTGTGAGTFNFASRTTGPCVMGTIDTSFSGMNDCYLDEVLITRGYAKYPTTGSISVPTQPFTVGPYTSQLMHMDGANNGTVFYNTVQN